MTMADQLPDLAVRWGLDRVRERLMAGAGVDTRDKDGRTALFRTARVGRVGHVQLLLEFGADPDACDSKGESPLQAAARYGHADCVELLLRHGAAVDYCPASELTEYSESALCSAVRRGSDAVVEILLRAGASPSAATSARRFPLHFAAWRGDVKLCRRLAESGAGINQRDKVGSTALHYAVANQRVETIRELLEMGADVNALNDKGFTPVHSAIGSYIEQCVPMLFALLKAKPDLSIPDQRVGRNPLEQAILCKMDEVVDLLRAAGAKESPTSCDPARDETPREVSVPAGTGATVTAYFQINRPAHSFEAKDQKLAEELSRGGSPGAA